MQRVSLGFLAVLVSCILIGALYAQLVLVPTVAADEVAAFPPYEQVRAPLVTMAVLFLACLEAGLVASTALLWRAIRGDAFEQPALRWMTILIGSTVAATVVAACLLAFVTVTDIPSPDDGMEVIGLWTGSAVLTVAGVGCTLVGVVLLRTLTRAVALRREIETVI